MPLVHMRLRTVSQTGAEGGKEEAVTFTTTGRKFQTLLSGTVNQGHQGALRVRATFIPQTLVPLHSESDTV